MLHLTLALLALVPLQENELTDDERLAAGWRRQDLEWVEPGDTDKIDQGLWKCGDAWLSLDDANAWHAEVDQWWRIPGERTRLYTTLPRAQAETALAGMEAAFDDMVRLFGIRPSEPPLVVALNSREQYLEFTGGDMEKRQMGKTFFMHQVHGAYFAENWFDEEQRRIPAGVAYWAVGDENEAAYGPLWVRHALGQAFLDFVDPSFEAVGALDGTKPGFEFLMNFWQEKKLPTWLRYGAAGYVERWFVDLTEEAKHDPNWARKWSVESVGEEREDVDDLMRMQVSPTDPDAVRRWMKQTGLLVAFLLDGESKSVAKAHGKFVEALAKYHENPDKGEKALKKAVDGLEKALEKSSKKIEKFAEAQ